MKFFFIYLDDPLKCLCNMYNKFYFALYFAFNSFYLFINFCKNVGIKMGT